MNIPDEFMTNAVLFIYDWFENGNSDNVTKTECRHVGFVRRFLRFFGPLRRPHPISPRPAVPVPAIVAYCLRRQ
jgi:hypothetical protein